MGIMVDCGQIKQCLHVFSSFSDYSARNICTMYLKITVRLIEIGCCSSETNFVGRSRGQWSSKIHTACNISSSTEGILADVVERGGWWD